MNENTTKLIEQLAAKLGTTSQYLWRVLIRQAALDATIQLMQIVVLMVSAYLFYRLHVKLYKPTEGRYSNLYDKYDCSTPMIVAACIISIFLVFQFWYVGNIFNGYFNPEYWALKEVLDSIKH